MDGQRDFQSKVGHFFDQLASRRDESYKQISDIINSHDSTIKEGISNLVKKVSNLQDELSIMRNERNVLLETVDHLNNEIRQFNEQVPAQEDKLLNDSEVSEVEAAITKDCHLGQSEEGKPIRRQNEVE